MATSCPPEVTSRVRDFLDDKIQTPADFEGLDALVQQVGQQQRLLQKQLDEANAELKKASEALAEHEAAIQRKSEAFQQQQSEIDQRLLEITKTTTSDDAVTVFESSMGKLRRLDLATGYLEVLQEVDSVVKSARDQCQSSPRAALPAYTRLRSLLEALQIAQPAAEGAAPHLLDHVEQQRLDVYTQIRDAASDRFNKSLNQMGWPSKELRVDNQVIAKWAEEANSLLGLQEPDLKSQFSSQREEAGVTKSPILLPLVIMVHPLRLRFRYHFDGDRPTNRLDKPEYFLSHILDILEDHSTFLLQYFQPILDDRVRSLPDLDDPLYPDATSAFISALLPMVEAKILALLPQISSHPQLLSHFMHELMSFDTALRDAWAYTPAASLLSDWKGLTWTVLVSHDYFDAWLKVEKDFALARYESIISTPDSREIDYESTESGTTKPTKGAMRVNDLLETITERYQPLSSFSHKLRFLIDIQLEIFDQYHLRLRGSLEKFILDTSTLGKVMQGSTGSTDEHRTKNDVHGMFGLESLCKVFGSAEYLERKMADWGDDVFFLELWDELQDRARQNRGVNGSVGRDLATSQVASRTSTTITYGNDQEGADGDGGGALFDETASAYSRLREQAEDQIKNLLVNSLTASLRPYSKISGWASLNSTPDSITTSTNTGPAPPSSALDTPFHLLSDRLGFLSRVLAPNPLRRITRRLCLAIQQYLWDNILMRHSFSASGTAQLQADLLALHRVIDGSTFKHQQRQHSTASEAARGMRKLSEAIHLLTLPTAEQTSHHTTTTTTTTSQKAGTETEAEAEEEEEEAEGWDFDDIPTTNNLDNHTPNPNLNPHDQNPIQWTLTQVEHRLFASNASARDVLRDMDLLTLTEVEARKVLERRVDVG